MAYNASFPADNSYLSDFPAGDREQNRALKDDQIVNAGKLQGLTAGNKNGQIPINNGTENANLNAALLNGKASSYFATSNHTHTTATQSSNGYMSNADKKKLDGIASGAEVNQNAFANVKVGTTTIQADAKQDTLTLAAGANIALTPDGNNDKVTIGVTGKVASATTADKVNGTASDGGVVNLVTGTMAVNDGFRIRVGGTNNSGYAEIATKDDGSEPIYVRQYTGDFATITRTATILDGSGNTSFPGRVTANGGFSGNLSGTATNATRDGNGNTITTHYLSRNQTLKNDMNACTVEGIYRFSGPLSNAWTGTSWGTLLVFNNNYNGGSGTDGTYLVQMAFPTDGKIYTRERVNTGAWTGWVTLARTSDNVASATKATQDKNGRDITGYLYKSESIGLDSNASVVTSGTISAILNAFCTKFKQIQGTGTYGESPPTSLKSLNDNKAPKASPAFSGTPTAPTPGTSDNGTRIATTAFVQSLINSLSNTVSGLTNAVNKKSQVYIGGGSGTAQQYKDFVIPLPSGYSRSQCKYAVFPTSIVLSKNHGYFSLSVDQSTGIVRGSVRSNITGGGYNYSDIGIGYLVVAVK